MPGRVIGDAGEHVGEPGLRVDAVELGGADQRVDRRRAFAAAIGAGRTARLAAERNRAAILPMSGRRSRSTTAGTRSMGVVSGVSTASGGSAVHVVHVEAAPGVVIVVAAWMLDPAACAGMAFGAPRVAQSALVELHRLLIAQRFQAKLPGRSDHRPGGAR